MPIVPKYSMYVCMYMLHSRSWQQQNKFLPRLCTPLPLNQLWLSALNKYSSLSANENSELYV